MTVKGTVSASLLGVTLPHEHLFLDLSTPYDRPEMRAPSRFAFPQNDVQRREWEEEFTARRASRLRKRLFGGNRDMLRLDEFSVAVREVTDFLAHGGGTIVDVTSRGMGQRPGDLLRLSDATGVNIVLGTGFYRRAYHPDDMDLIGTRELEEIMVRDLREGIDGTSVRAGLIGEIGAEHFDDNVETNEMRVLTAAARASTATGAAISLHNHIGRPDLWHKGPDHLERAGADPSRVVIGHVTGVDLDVVESLLARGVYVEFDTLGLPLMLDVPQVDTRTNVDLIVELVARGHVERILMSQDVCTKAQLHEYGGNGYDYVLTDVVPYLESRGLTSADIDTIIRRNPARVLS
ncbi:phosphotriesterase [Amycolatopsis sp. K13G38]|uniref:Phosphotriesterase n=1 Tax=Amycolatopsis acididurans TaxID=2724524 RepID=A0ABX1JEJ4_9PSEU|nr:phosphotriesterase [Amycolatopsis acididurans]NKQ58202.1 phosphotriesterase [Amycolatopsis acididurans]